MIKHVNKDGICCLLAITIDDENEDIFTKLGDTTAELACKWKTKFSKLKLSKPSDLELVKTSANEKYKYVEQKDPVATHSWSVGWMSPYSSVF